MKTRDRVRVLFVCMGNICRSPTAEGVFRRLVQDASLSDRIEVDSAGTHAYHVGEPPDPRSQEEAQRHGVDLSRQRARKVALRDFTTYDYIVAMDEDNFAALAAQCPAPEKKRLYRLCDFAEGCGVQSVPDPYYGGANGFRDVYRLIETGAQGLLATIQNEDFGHAGRRAQGD